MRFPSKFLVITMLHAAAACQSGQKTQSTSTLNASSDVTEIKELGQGIFMVKCNFARDEVTTMKLFSAQKVCDRKAKNYIKSAAPWEGGFYKLTCATDKQFVATMAQINSGNLCGLSAFVCSCDLVDDSSLFGYSRHATGVEIRAVSAQDAAAEMHRNACFEAVTKANPFFRKALSSPANIECAEKKN